MNELELLFETYTNWAFFLKSSVILQSIWSSKIPPTPTDNPLSIYTFENFTPWNTSMLKKKSILLERLDGSDSNSSPHQSKIQTPQPSQGRKRNIFGLLKLNKKLGICLIPTNLMT